MKKLKKNSDSIFNSLDMLSGTLEGLIFGIPYLIVTSIGTLIKVLFLSLISILTFNKWIKLNSLWSKKYLSSNISNPWNLVLTLVCVIILANIF